MTRIWNGFLALVLIRIFQINEISTTTTTTKPYPIKLNKHKSKTKAKQKHFSLVWNGCSPWYRSLVRSEVENIVDESNPQHEKQSWCCPVTSIPTISVLTLQFSSIFNSWVFWILSVEGAIIDLKATHFLKCRNWVFGFTENWRVWVWGSDKWDSGVGVAGFERNKWESREVAGDEGGAGQIGRESCSGRVSLCFENESFKLFCWHGMIYWWNGEI